jgi:hypothetical protein
VGVQSVEVGLELGGRSITLLQSRLPPCQLRLERRQLSALPRARLLRPRQRRRARRQRGAKRVDLGGAPRGGELGGRGGRVARGGAGGGLVKRRALLVDRGSRGVGVGLARAELAVAVL